MHNRPDVLLHHDFTRLPDPCVERSPGHQLLGVITIAVCAIVAGAESFVEIAEFVRAWLTR